MQENLALNTCPISGGFTDLNMQVCQKWVEFSARTAPYGSCVHEQQKQLLNSAYGTRASIAQYGSQIHEQQNQLLNSAYSIRTSIAHYESQIHEQQKQLLNT